eukprot:Colp12_sorted_trinity150504_noHs@27757
MKSSFQIMDAFSVQLVLGLFVAVCLATLIKSFAKREDRFVLELLQRADIVVGKDVTFKHPDVILKWYRGSLGIAETYISKEWSVNAISLKEFHRRLASVPASFKRRLFQTWAFKLSWLLMYVRNYHSVSLDKHSVTSHYDIGNSLYEAFLDSNMQYTCGYWKDARSLEDAQITKMRLLASKLKLRPGMTVLDIGCGWGGFAKYLASHYGAVVTGITISDEQVALAHTKYHHPQVTVLNQDYRLHRPSQQYDRIVSVGMYEHVGKTNGPIFFKSVHNYLKDDGILLLHCIGVNRPLKKVDDFILKYIFPNGHIHSLMEIMRDVSGLFTLEDVQNFGYDYSLTLDAWREKFFRSIAEGRISPDENFTRMWDYYLSSCSAMFDQRQCHLYQIVFTKGRNYHARYDAAR